MSPLHLWELIGVTLLALLAIWMFANWSLDLISWGWKNRTRTASARSAERAQNPGTPGRRISGVQRNGERSD